MDSCGFCLRLGQKAPDFKAVSTFGPVSLSDYKGKWLILFSHPGDLSPVTERQNSESLDLIAFQHL
ncbi:MAG: redoxin domain-containing protein [Clostridiaceae bacterium]|nr:redoxin domain-containing protein [Clostridiaceae bacterium]